MLTDDRGARAGRCAIAVMGKAPQSGRSKTRLVPAVSFDEAARLSAAFLRDTTDNIARAGRDAPIDGFVAYAPAGTDGLLRPHLADGTALLLADGEGAWPWGVDGFGRCLLQATAAMLRSGYGSACVLNSDGPTLPTRFLVEAARLLSAPGDRAVLGPAEDGGYYLLGLKQAHAALFTDIRWSTEHVAAETRARAAAIGLPVVELAPWYDVDDGASLDRLRAALRDGASDGFEAPATRECLRDLGRLGTHAAPA